MKEDKEIKKEEVNEDDIYSGNSENPNFQGKNWVNGEPVRKPKETVIITIVLGILLTIGIAWAIIAFFVNLLSF